MVALVAIMIGFGSLAYSSLTPVAAVSPTTISVFGTQTPSTTSEADSAAVELGMRFRASTTGTVVGLKFYKGPGNDGIHIGHLWTKAGVLLAAVTFSNETAGGWQTATFDAPQAVAANTTYVVSYHTNSGHYAADYDVFTAARTNGVLTAPADLLNAPNGAFRYGAGGFPTSSWRSTNYYVDPLFQAGTVVSPTTVSTATSPIPTTMQPALTTTAGPTTTAPTTTAAPTTTTTTRPATTTTSATSVPSTTTTRLATTTTAPPITTTTTTTPPPAVFPTPQTTGWAPTGVALTPYTGPSIITTAGTVIDGKDITTCLAVKAPNVSITRSRVRCAGDFGIEQRGNAQGLLVQDVEITSDGGILDRAVLFQDGAIMRRVYVHAMQRGIAVGSNTTVESSYVGENQNGTDAHTSAIMTSGGSRHVIVRFNTLQTAPNTNASSAISFYPELWAGGANDDFLIEGNLLNSGGGYATYLGHTPSSGESPNTHFRFINNRFGTLYFPACGIYGPSASWSVDATNTWSGNTWYDLRPTTGGYTNRNGQPVPP